MTSAGIIRSFYLIAGLYTLAAALIWGINTLFLLNAGLDIFEVFLANAAFTAGIVVFEIPTGVIADTVGRRVSFLISTVLLILATLMYVAVAETNGGLARFALVSVFLGLGFTFYTGAVEAWLVDALKATGFTGTLDRVFARGGMVTGLAMLTGTLAGGFLGNVNLSLPYIARAALLGLAFTVALFSMRDLGFKPRRVRAREFPREMRRVAGNSIAYGWRHASIRGFMAVSFVQAGFLSWAFYAWPPYFLELLGSDAVWISGAVASGIAASTIMGNIVVEWFARRCGHRTTLLIGAAVVQTLAAIGVGLVNDFASAVTLLLIATAAMGVSGPVTQAYLHQVTPSEYRASVISAVSMMGNGGGVVGQGGLGYLSRARSVGEGFLVGGALTLLVLPLLYRIRGYQDEADRFVGEQAGRRSPCTAQGMPEAAQIDTTARRTTD